MQTYNAELLCTDGQDSRLKLVYSDYFCMKERFLSTCIIFMLSLFPSVGKFLDFCFKSMKFFLNSE